MRLLFFTAIALWSVSMSFAAGKAAGRTPDVVDRALQAKTKPRDSETAAPATSEVFENIVLVAGKGAVLDSSLDYGSAATVAVAVQCNSCLSATTSLAAAGLSLQARWKVPGADYYTTTESKSASAFPYWDAGGVLFNVFGAKLQIILQNTGTQTLSISQITLFRRAP